MTDYLEGIKKDVAEIKFLIHDLRVEKFINDIIHYQVTLNTDLEIHNIEQVALVHSQDLYELKRKAQDLRNALRAYSNAVKSFSPPETILAAGNFYVETIQDICELIINPLWGRFDSVISFLPRDCRSVKSVRHYKNCLHWICGVYYRIEHFLEEKGGADLYQEFDVGADIEQFTINVIRGYVREKSSSRVDILFDRLDSAVIGGNKYRFRRMFFNLVMNAVDAMSEQQVGTLRIGVHRHETRVQLTVGDDGCGMGEDKVATLLSDRQTLDGELHSLGFVFVRRTAADFDGQIEIDSTPGEGTRITVSLPYMKEKMLPARSPSKCEKFRASLETAEEPEPAPVEALPGEVAAAAGPLTERKLPRQELPPDPEERANDERQYGQILLSDYRVSRSNFPGCIFAISMDDSKAVDLFYHRPYEEHWDISHEDLLPMLYDATVRGRIEEDGDKKPCLILKAPLNLREYLTFKGLDESEFSPQRYNDAVRNEYIEISRNLIRTGLPGEMTVQATDLRKVFADYDSCFDQEPFPVRILAEQKRTDER